MKRTNGVVKMSEPSMVKVVAIVAIALALGLALTNNLTNDKTGFVGSDSVGAVACAVINTETVTRDGTGTIPAQVVTGFFSVQSSAVTRNLNAYAAFFSPYTTSNGLQKGAGQLAIEDCKAKISTAVVERQNAQRRQCLLVATCEYEPGQVSPASCAVTECWLRIPSNETNGASATFYLFQSPQYNPDNHMVTAGTGTRRNPLRASESPTYTVGAGCRATGTVQVAAPICKSPPPAVGGGSGGNGE